MQNEGSGQSSHEPVVSGCPLCRCSRYWPLATSRISIFCGRPFLGVSFRDFTADPNAGKGTPTAQLFDNRSIA
jgi:hypothetical protein